MHIIIHGRSLLRLFIGRESADLEALAIAHLAIEADAAHGVKSFISRLFAARWSAFHWATALLVVSLRLWGLGRLMVLAAGVEVPGLLRFLLLFRRRIGLIDLH